MQKDIIIKGAKVHNLKNVSLKVPRDKLVVFTGLSGSGKSSLAFDTIYAEGQRRYMESLSSYARQFLGQMDKPDVESIEGLSPAVSIDQKTTSKNPRSTVGTVTEIYDYLRLLYARTGIPHCPICNREITSQTVDQIVDKILNMGDNKKIQIMSPIVRGEKGEHGKKLDVAKKEAVKLNEILLLYYGADYKAIAKNKIKDYLVSNKMIKEDEFTYAITGLENFYIKDSKVHMIFNSEEIVNSKYGIIDITI